MPVKLVRGILCHCCLEVEVVRRPVDSGKRNPEVAEAWRLAVDAFYDIGAMQSAVWQDPHAEPPGIQSR